MLLPIRPRMAEAVWTESFTTKIEQQCAYYGVPLQATGLDNEAFESALG